MNYVSKSSVVSSFLLLVSVSSVAFAQAGLSSLPRKVQTAVESIVRSEFPCASSVEVVSNQHRSSQIDQQLIDTRHEIVLQVDVSEGKSPGGRVEVVVIERSDTDRADVEIRSSNLVCH